MIGLGQRRVIPGHDGVAEELIHSAFISEHCIRSCGEITIQDCHQFFRRVLFAISGEAANIREQDRNIHFFAADL